MIATPFFVYLHLHKSGGTFVNECVLRFVPGATQLGYHLPRRMIPEPLRYLPVIGFVRNPWSYYVSWYSFQSAMRQPNHLFRCTSRDGTLDFKHTVRNLLMLSSDGHKLDEVLAGLPEHYGQSGLNLPRSQLETIRGTGRGFYSFLYRHMFLARGKPAVIGQAESLRADLPRMLSALEVPPSEPRDEFIRSQPAANPSDHGDYTSYYDAELRDLVAARDREVIELHGYAFGQPGTPSP